MGDRINNLTIDGKKLIRELKVLELRTELERRGLSKYGNKKELLQRLSIFEENRQKSLSGQPNCEAPNQWLENEADLNNDFLREYFRSQKALFEEHAQRRTEIGVGEVPSVSQRTEQSQHKDEILLSGSDRESISSPIIAPCPTSKKKKRRNKSSSQDKQVTHASPTYESSLVSSRPCRSSAQTSRALNVVSFDEEDSEGTDADPYAFEFKHKRKGHKKHPRIPTLKLQTPFVNPDVQSKPTLPFPSKKDEEKDRLAYKVPSLKIKLPEPVPKISTSNVSPIKEYINCKLKIIRDENEFSTGASVSKKTSKVCLSPQNAEVSSSVEEIPTIPIEEPQPDSQVDSTSNEGNSSSDNENHISKERNEVTTPENADSNLHKVTQNLNLKISSRKLNSLGDQQWYSEANPQKVSPLLTLSSKNEERTVTSRKEPEINACLNSPVPPVQADGVKPTVRKRGRPRIYPLSVAAQSSQVHSGSEKSIANDPVPNKRSPKSIYSSSLETQSSQVHSGSHKSNTNDNAPSNLAPKTYAISDAVQLTPVHCGSHKPIISDHSPSKVSPKTTLQISVASPSSQVLTGSRRPIAKESPLSKISPKRKIIKKLNELKLLNDQQSIENKMKEDHINLRLKELDLKESLLKDMPVQSNVLSLTTSLSKKKAESIRRSSRLYKSVPMETVRKKVDVSSPRSVKPSQSISSCQKPLRKALPVKNQLEKIKNSLSCDQPDYFQILKQQIEMPLHVEKFPSCDKSEVSSTSELSEATKPVKSISKVPSSFQPITRETPILDAHMVVEGHTSHASIINPNDKNVADSPLVTTVSQKLKSVSHSLDQSKFVGKDKSDWISKHKCSGYLIENLIEKCKEKETNSEILTPVISPEITYTHNRGIHSLESSLSLLSNKECSSVSLKLVQSDTVKQGKRDSTLASGSSETSKFPDIVSGSYMIPDITETLQAKEYSFLNCSKKLKGTVASTHLQDHVGPVEDLEGKGNSSEEVFMGMSEQVNLCSNLSLLKGIASAEEIKDLEGTSDKSTEKIKLNTENTDPKTLCTEIIDPQASPGFTSTSEHPVISRVEVPEGTKTSISALSADDPCVLPVPLVGVLPEQTSEIRDNLAEQKNDETIMPFTGYNLEARLSTNSILEDLVSTENIEIQKNQERAPFDLPKALLPVEIPKSSYSKPADPALNIEMLENADDGLPKSAIATLGSNFSLDTQRPNLSIGVDQSLSDKVNFKDILMEAALAADIDSDELGDGLTHASSEEESGGALSKEIKGAEFGVERDFEKSNLHIPIIAREQKKINSFENVFSKQLLSGEPCDKNENILKEIEARRDKHSLLIDAPLGSKFNRTATKAIAGRPSSKKLNFIEKLSANVYQAKKDSSKGLMEIIFDLDKKSSRLNKKEKIQLEPISNESAADIKVDKNTSQFLQAQSKSDKIKLFSDNQTTCTSTIVTENTFIKSISNIGISVDPANDQKENNSLCSEQVEPIVEMQSPNNMLELPDNSTSLLSNHPHVATNQEMDKPLTNIHAESRDNNGTHPISSVGILLETSLQSSYKNDSELQSKSLTLNIKSYSDQIKDKPAIVDSTPSYEEFISSKDAQNTLVSEVCEDSSLKIVNVGLQDMKHPSNAESELENESSAESNAKSELGNESSLADITDEESFEERNIVAALLNAYEEQVKNDMSLTDKNILGERQYFSQSGDDKLNKETESTLSPQSISNFSESASSLKGEICVFQNKLNKVEDSSDKTVSVPLVSPNKALSDILDFNNSPKLRPQGSGLLKSESEESVKNQLFSTEREEDVNRVKSSDLLESVQTNISYDKVTSLAMIGGVTVFAGPDLIASDSDEKSFVGTTLSQINDKVAGSLLVNDVPSQIPQYSCSEKSAATLLQPPIITKNKDCNILEEKDRIIEKTLCKESDILHITKPKNDANEITSLQSIPPQQETGSESSSSVKVPMTSPITIHTTDDSVSAAVVSSVTAELLLREAVTDHQVDFKLLPLKMASNANSNSVTTSNKSNSIMSATESKTVNETQQKPKIQKINLVTKVSVLQKIVPGKQTKEEQFINEDEQKELTVSVVEPSNTIKSVWNEYSSILGNPPDIATHTMTDFCGNDSLPGMKSTVSALSLNIEIKSDKSSMVQVAPDEVLSFASKSLLCSIVRGKSNNEKFELGENFPALNPKSDAVYAISQSEDKVCEGGGHSFNSERIECIEIPSIEEKECKEQIFRSDELLKKQPSTYFDLWDERDKPTHGTTDTKKMFCKDLATTRTNELDSSPSLTDLNDQTVSKNVKSDNLTGLGPIKEFPSLQNEDASYCAANTFNTNNDNTFALKDSSYIDKCSSEEEKLFVGKTPHSSKENRHRSLAYQKLAGDILVESSMTAQELGAKDTGIPLDVPCSGNGKSPYLGQRPLTEIPSGPFKKSSNLSKELSELEDVSMLHQKPPNTCEAGFFSDIQNVLLDKSFVKQLEPIVSSHNAAEVKFQKVSYISPDAEFSKHSLISAVSEKLMRKCTENPIQNIGNMPQAYNLEIKSNPQTLLESSINVNKNISTSGNVEYKACEDFMKLEVGAKLSPKISPKQIKTVLESSDVKQPLRNPVKTQIKLSPLSVAETDPSQVNIERAGDLKNNLSALAKFAANSRNQPQVKKISLPMKLVDNLPSTEGKSLLVANACLGQLTSSQSEEKDTLCKESELSHIDKNKVLCTKRFSEDSKSEQAFLVQKKLVNLKGEKLSSCSQTIIKGLDIQSDTIKQFQSSDHPALELREKNVSEIVDPNNAISIHLPQQTENEKHFTLERDKAKNDKMLIGDSRNEISINLTQQTEEKKHFYLEKDKSKKDQMLIEDSDNGISIHLTQQTENEKHFTLEKDKAKKDPMLIIDSDNEISIHLPQQTEEVKHFFKANNDQMLIADITSHKQKQFFDEEVECMKSPVLSYTNKIQQKIISQTDTQTLPISTMAGNLDMHSNINKEIAKQKLIYNTTVDLQIHELSLSSSLLRREELSDPVNQKCSLEMHVSAILTQDEITSSTETGEIENANLADKENNSKAFQNVKQLDMLNLHETEKYTELCIEKVACAVESDEQKSLQFGIFKTSQPTEILKNVEVTDALLSNNILFGEDLMPVVSGTDAKLLAASSTISMLPSETDNNVFPHLTDISSIPLPPAVNQDNEEHCAPLIVVKRGSLPYDSNAWNITTSQISSMARRNKLEEVAASQKDPSNGDIKEEAHSPKRMSTRARSRSKSIEKDLVAAAAIERKAVKLRRSSRSDRTSLEKVDIKPENEKNGATNIQKLESIREAMEVSVNDAGKLNESIDATSNKLGASIANPADIPMPDLASVPLPEPKTANSSLLDCQVANSEDKESQLVVADSKLTAPNNAENEIVIQSDLVEANQQECNDGAATAKVVEIAAIPDMVPDKMDRKSMTSHSIKKSSTEELKSKHHSRSRSASSSSSDRSTSKRKSSRKSSRHSTSRKKSPSSSSRHHKKSSRYSRRSSHKADDRSRSRSSETSSARKKEERKEEKKNKDDKKDKEDNQDVKGKDDHKETKDKKMDTKIRSSVSDKTSVKADDDISSVKKSTKEETSIKRDKEEDSALKSKDGTNSLRDRDSRQELLSKKESSSSKKESSLLSKDSKKNSSKNRDVRKESSKESKEIVDSSITSDLKEIELSLSAKEASDMKDFERCLSEEKDTHDKSGKEAIVETVTKMKEPEVIFKSARKVGLLRPKSVEGDEQDKPKKRKWGSSAASKPNVEISSNSLKSLIPDVKPLSPSELKLKSSSESSDDGAEEDEVAMNINEDDVISDVEEKYFDTPVEVKKVTEKELPKVESEDEGRPEISPSKRKRSVSPEKRKREKNERRESRRDRTAKEVSPRRQRKRSQDKNDRPVAVRRISAMEAGPSFASSKLSIAPAKNPVTNVIIVQNLVRPFTVKAIRDLLLRTGRLAENGFWMDRIKSTCLAMYETVDQAEETRAALHGVKWPADNHRNLSVDFSTLHELKEKLADVTNSVSKPSVEEPRRERRRLEGPIREWDLAKVGERSPGEREREKERQRKEREEEREREKRRREQSPKEERKPKKPPPVKSVDDLFRKTLASPSIYWLPLSPEQIAEKEAHRRKKMAESERILAEMKEMRMKKREKEREKEKELKEKEKEQREKEKNSKRTRSRSYRRSRSRSTRKSPRRSPRRSRRSASRNSRKSHRRSRSRSRS